MPKDTQAGGESSKARRDWISIMIAVFAVLISVKAARDAGRSTDIAAESLKVQQESMENSQRPYIGVEPVLIGHGIATFQLKAYGGSPAKIISITSSCEFTHFPPRLEDGGGGSSGFGGGEGEVLNPGSIRLFTCEHPKEAPNPLVRGVTIKGIITYRDIMQKEHNCIAPR